MTAPTPAEAVAKKEAAIGEALAAHSKFLRKQREADAAREARLAALRAAWRAGASNTEVAHALGMSPQNVSRLLAGN